MTNAFHTAYERETAHRITIAKPSTPKTGKVRIKAADETLPLQGFLVFPTCTQILSWILHATNSTGTLINSRVMCTI